MIEIEFQINYRTHGDEKVCLTGSVPELGNNETESALPMQYSGNGNWVTTLKFDHNDIWFQYNYCIIINGTIIDKEWGQPRSFVYNDTNEYYRLCDHWQTTPPNKPFFSSAFTKYLFARTGVKRTNPEPHPFRRSLTLRVFAPTIRPEHTLAILGNNPILGNWQPENAIFLNSDHFPNGM